MSVLSNGTTEITLSEASEKDRFNIEKTTVRSSGGKLKTQTNRGRRYEAIVEARVSAAVYESILDMLHDQSVSYFYTPRDTAKAVNSGYTFPKEVEVTLQDAYFDNALVYHIRFEVRGVDPD